MLTKAKKQERRGTDGFQGFAVLWIKPIDEFTGPRSTQSVTASDSTAIRGMVRNPSRSQQFCKRGFRMNEQPFRWILRIIVVVGIAFPANAGAQVLDTVIEWHRLLQVTVAGTPTPTVFFTRPYAMTGIPRCSMHSTRSNMCTSLT